MGKGDSIYSFCESFSSEEKCILHLEKMRWNGTPVCPHCACGSKQYQIKGRENAKLYKCGECKMKYTVTVGTIFENTKLPLRKWFMALYLVTSHKKGISSHQLSRDIGVTQRTAWYMLQRLREMLKNESMEKLEGVVEADETYVGGKNKNRHRDKKVPMSQGRSHKDKTPVMGLLQRGGRLVAKAVTDVSNTTLKREVLAHVKPSSTLYTDEWTGYNGLSKIYEHSIVHHGRGEYVNGEAYTNSVENFWSHLKRGIIGIYHQTSRKHLQRYVDEFVFRYNTREMGVLDRFNLSFEGINRRLTYKALVAKSS